MSEKSNTNVVTCKQCGGMGVHAKGCPILRVQEQNRKFLAMLDTDEGKDEINQQLSDRINRARGGPGVSSNRLEQLKREAPPGKGAFGASRGIFPTPEEEKQVAMSDAEEAVTLQDCRGIRWSDSKKALLVEYEGETEWIPNVCIHDDSECCKPDTEGTLKIPLKLAREKNFA